MISIYRLDLNPKDPQFFPACLRLHRHSSGDELQFPGYQQDNKSLKNLNIISIA